MTDIPAATPLVADGPTCLEVRGLGLWRGERVVLDEVSFSLAAGQLGALFGPHHAGKSAVFHLLSGWSRPASGTAWLDGVELDQRREKLGLVFREPCLDRRLSVEAYLLLAAGLYGLQGQVARDRAMELLAFIELGDRRDELVSTLDLEQCHRLELARALIHQPRLLLVDEPGAGLCPAARNRFWRRLLALRRSKELAILVTTDQAEEAERCDHLVLMDRGRVLAEGTPAALAGRQADELILLEVDGAERIAEQLRRGSELVVSVRDGRVQIIAPGGAALLAELVAAIGAEHVRSAVVRRPTVADAFVALTGRGLHDDGGGA